MVKHSQSYKSQSLVFQGMGTGPTDPDTRRLLQQDFPSLQNQSSDRQGGQQIPSCEWKINRLSRTQTSSF